MHMRPFALPLFLVPSIASADVSPQDVWDNMVAGYGAAGFDLSATLESDGDTLIANDGIVTLTYPVIGGQATVTFPPMTLSDEGDGTVRIAVPSTYVSTVTADVPEEAEQITLDLTIALDGFDSTAAGDPGDVTYTSNVSDFDMLASNLSVPGEEFETFGSQTASPTAPP